MFAAKGDNLLGDGCELHGGLGGQRGRGPTKDWAVGERLERQIAKSLDRMSNCRAIGYNRCVVIAVDGSSEIRPELARAPPRCIAESAIEYRRGMLHEPHT